MAETPASSSSPAWLPRLDGRALDALKIMAALAMVVDHVDFFCLGRDRPLFFLVGRMAFPLFCYCVAVAAARGGGARARDYGLGLLFLALAVEPVSALTRYGMMETGNVLFTLACGAFFAAAAARMRDRWVIACYALAVLQQPLPQAFEFGLAGAMLPSAFLLVMQGRREFTPFLVLLLFSANASSLFSGMGEVAPGKVLAAVFLTGCAAAFLPLAALRAASVFPGGGRLLPRYFLHAFYPLHLLALWAAMLAFFR